MAVRTANIDKNEKRTLL